MTAEQIEAWVGEVSKGFGSKYIFTF